MMWCVTEHLTPMVDSVIKISEELTQIETLQHHMRIREQSHRDCMCRPTDALQPLPTHSFVVLLVLCAAAESTNARVQWMSILESVRRS